MQVEKDYHIDKNYIGEPLFCGNVYLVQIGRLYFRGAGAVAEHLHRGWFELTAVTGGEGTVTLDGGEVAVREGDICLSLPAEVHKITSNAVHPLRYDFFSFYTEEPILAAELERIAADFRAPASRIFSDDKLRTLIGVAIGELENREALLSHRLLSHPLEEIVIRLCRGFRGTLPAESADPGGAERLCFRLQQYIDTHVFTLHNLSEIAPLFGYNYSYLSSLFKRTTGGTLSEYYLGARWRVARLLVREGKSRMSEIAEMLGYSSVYVFSRAYRTRFGVPPTRDRVEQ